ncbi:MAG TPA: hypothetical protein VLW50_19710 [Streptosporangiaceae bacterium]|nr:hypothetical protein [Streptosporangiaceae bacterium]
MTARIIVAAAAAVLFAAWWWLLLSPAAGLGYWLRGCSYRPSHKAPAWHDERFERIPGPEFRGAYAAPWAPAEAPLWQAPSMVPSDSIVMEAVRDA